MKKTKITILLTLISIHSVLYAQSNKPTFETGLKFQKAEFTPFDYSRNFTDSDPYWNIKVNKLNGNQKTITPFFFIYKNLEKGFGIEFEHSKIQIERANYEEDYVYQVRNQYYFDRTRQYLRNNERSDFKLNLFFYPTPEIKEYFAIGLGIRKIDRIRNISEYSFNAEEKISAYGPQIVLKSKIPITDQLSLNLGLDFYHTQGKRTYQYFDSYLFYYPSGSASDFSTIKGNPKTQGIFQGYEANVSLKYNFMENYNIAFGYNYNYAYFKYENLRDTYYYYSSFQNTYGFQDSKLSNGKEIIKGFYISASTVF
ncbi:MULTISPECIES: LA_2444/LA_4059 family outer membrane protein [Leptospira]|uniref:LA_2444/LA_4059 family outer membrane protein n=1 Tax=Leptospira TaxID=171 RepID=UPI001082BF33|nr:MULTISPECIES: LA_2444/LA_4059 family outer membrane protein [Leptospira]MCG6142828.1 LA_2444/LA_4059 family outer membrane protein [Leptospira mtsangambouensis]TGM65864.1 hypothetical protein EHQ93_08940 [Leptospira meyeri]TGM72077.1 hypothetical protein EHQ94_02165 [Leptospira meyeri]